MANYSITFSCGHTVDKQLVGKMADRERYIAWAAARGECAACQAADKAKAMEAVEVENGLPALVGSEKQIAWARGIRAEKIGEIQKWFASVRARVSPDKIELFEEQCAVTMQAVGESGSASWWIDRRGEAGSVIASNAFKAVTK